MIFDSLFRLCGLGLSAAGGYESHDEDRQGAWLVLDYPAYEETLAVGRQTVEYIKRHYTSWVEFAESDEGFGLLNADLIFVNGCLKTASSWSMAVANDSAQESHKMSPKATSRTSKSNMSSIASRKWPVNPRPSDPPTSPTYDHCIFLQYHKARHRRHQDKFIDVCTS